MKQITSTNVEDCIRMKRFIKEKYFNFRYINLKKFIKWQINLAIKLFNSLYPHEAIVVVESH